MFLDLDETLIHACSISENPQHIIKGTGPYGSEILIGFNVRPYCLEFLKKLSQFYEIVIFTASMSNYAHAIVNFLDPYHQYISEVLTRSSCIRSKNGFFIKDLRIIKNRELKNMMIVDNLSHSFGFQIDNGIPILEFLNDRKDRELKHLYDHLLEGLYVDDVRVFNRKKLQLNLLSEMRIEDLRIL